MIARIKFMMLLWRFKREAREALKNFIGEENAGDTVKKAQKAVWKVYKKYEAESDALYQQYGKKFIVDEMTIQCDSIRFDRPVSRIAVIIQIGDTIEVATKPKW